MIFLVGHDEEQLCLTFLSPLMEMGSKFQDNEKNPDLKLICTIFECLQGGQANISSSGWDQRKHHG